ncbi:S41 family peptidase [Flagellimonas sp. S174]|uniref:S41 family peptidase n=1 Tax=Flagellimonas sp. S174 TaxID=3410790 RepID=UPI003BF4BB44
MRKILGSIVVLALCFSSCSKDKKKETTIEGTWQSLGNSWILDVAKDGSYTEYDVTRVSCLVARNSHIDEFGDRLYLQNDTLKLRRGAIEYRFVRSEFLPEACGQSLDEETARDPIFNYEVFASTIKDNYAFFEMNNVNWDSIYRAHKKQITASPSDITLYKVMEETFEAINDNHGSFEASDSIYEQWEAIEGGNEEETDALPEIGDFQVASAVAKNHLENEMTRESPILQWGEFTEGIGYIQVKAMFLYTDLGMSKDLIKTLGWEAAWQKTFNEIGEGNYIEKEREGMERVMKMAMNDLKNMDAIILDLRFNGGGQDLVSLELLSWFNDTPKLIAHESLVYNGGESPQGNIILPANEAAFTKPVYLLTSKQTGSAAEVCAMASMTLPHATRIGMPTMGALSTALEKKLPNGWDFAISNEYYRTPSGQMYENKGIPVDIEIPYPKDRQIFFRGVLDSLIRDKESILQVIKHFEK